MQPRLFIVILALVLGLPLLGYVWPSPNSVANAPLGQDWQWPKAQPQQIIEPEPKLLARFWPITETANDTEQSSSAATAKAESEPQPVKLVAIVRQGQQQQALILDSNGELKTLNQGEQLDEQRRISAINSSAIRWHTLGDIAEQGELRLYPRPTNHSDSASDTSDNDTTEVNTSSVTPTNVNHE